MKCRYCDYYKARSDVPDAGDCRLEPPKLVVVDNKAQALYPPVAADAFCQHYAANPASPSPPHVPESQLTEKSKRLIKQVSPVVRRKK